MITTATWSAEASKYFMHTQREIWTSSDGIEWYDENNFRVRPNELDPLQIRFVERAKNGELKDPRIENCYKIQWEIDVIACNADEAIKQALKIMNDPNSDALCFRWQNTEKKIQGIVDLSGETDPPDYIGNPYK